MFIRAHEMLACLQRSWSFHLRSSGFYIPAMHHRSHCAEEVLHRSVHTGLFSPAVLKVESGVQDNHLGIFWSSDEQFNLIKNTACLGLMDGI